ncbi:MAG: hypothetical protein RI894_1785 [Bacteroidota bacterium]
MLVLLLLVGSFGANAQAPCTASFAASSSGATFTFTNTSVLNPNQAYTATWAFGDGTASHDLHAATHTYAHTGTYTVCMTLVDSSISCNSSTCHAVVVTALPTCNMTGTVTTTTQALVATVATSVTGGTAPYTYVWHTGAGHTLTTTGSANPYTQSFTYGAAGAYGSCIGVTDANGCTFNHCDTVSVSNTTACAYSVSVIDTLNGQISVAFGSNNPAQGIPPTSYWSVAGVHHGMNATGTASFPYSGAGTYEICAVIPAGLACFGNYCTTVVIAATPNACNLTASFVAIPDSSAPNTFHFINTSTGNYTHASWHFSGSTVAYPNLHGITHTFSGAGPFLVRLEVSGNGCSSSFTDTLTIATPTTPCIADFTYSVQGGIVAFNSTNSTSWITNGTWHFGDGSVSHDMNITHTFAADGIYHVCLEANNLATCPTFPCGCHGVVCHDIIVNTHPLDSTCLAGNCVFPGDANHDGLANNFDVLSIGLDWGSTGTPRADNSIGWYAHSAADWNNVSPNSAVDMKHADSNGNGTINGDDVPAITQNYNRTHNGVSATNRLLTAPVPVYLQFTGDTIQVGNSSVVYADIMLGNAANPTQDIYGAAFTINYPTELIAGGSEITLSYNTNAFLGTTANVYPFKHDSRADGQLDLAVTRKAHTAVNGYGKIGTVGFTITDNISGRVMATRLFAPTISNIMVVNAQGVLKPFAEQNMHTVLQSTVLATENGNSLAAQVGLFPNPASNQVSIQLNDLKASKIEVTNMLGQLVITDIIQERSSYTLAITSLVSGVYNVTIATDKGSVTKRLIVE